MGLSLNNSADLLYSLTIVFSGALAIIALFFQKIDSRFLHHMFRIGHVLVLSLSFRLFFASLSTFSALFIAEISYFILTLIGDFIPYKSKMQRNYGFITVLLVIAWLIILKTSSWATWLIDLPTTQIAMVHVATNIVFIIVLHLRKMPQQKLLPFFINAIGSLTLFFVVNLNGIFLLTLLKAIFYAQLISLLFKEISDYHRSKLAKAKAIEKNFNDVLRKEVNQKLFYMELSKEKMAKKARIDELTGALNKKTLLDAIEKLILDKRTHVFSILMFDLDNFKSINDSLGHIVGDKCLKQLVIIGRESIRDNDEIGRYGGDEFFILLPHADIRTAVVVSERFRQNIEKTNDPSFTVSIGIASYPEDGKTVKALLAHADEGLYLSKEKGRNKTSYKKRASNQSINS